MIGLETVVVDYYEIQDFSRMDAPELFRMSNWDEAESEYEKRCKKFPRSTIKLVAVICES